MGASKGPGYDPSLLVCDGVSRTHDGKRLPSSKILFRRWRWQILLMPRGRRREYAKWLVERPSIRFGHFRRRKYSTSLTIFLPALPWVGAWRLVIFRHAPLSAPDVAAGVERP